MKSSETEMMLRLHPLEYVVYLALAWVSGLLIGWGVWG